MGKSRLFFILFFILSINGFMGQSLQQVVAEERVHTEWTLQKEGQG